MELTLIHVGDFHGHLIPRADCRSPYPHAERGGLARVYHKIKEIRATSKHSLLFNTGDTIQGSAEVLYTRGLAITEILNHFGFDAFAPGNWDFVYGTKRFLELFSGPKPLAPWNAVAANLYFADVQDVPDSPYPELSGARVLPPYLLLNIGEVRVAVLGFTTERGPQALGPSATHGFRFSGGDVEFAEFIPLLRSQASIVIAVSELGLANNIRLAEAYPGIDVILSSDMHEETRQAVTTKTGTVIVEEGQDGTVLGEMVLHIEEGKIKSVKWSQHVIDENIPEDPNIAALVRKVRAPFVSGPDFTPLPNPFNGSLLQRPIDSVIGYTKVALHRSNFSQSDMPAVIEGSSHDFLADAFRHQCGADIGAIRGFRYGTHVKAGPIKLEDLYHFIPIGPQIASGTITGEQLKKQIEKSAHGSLSPRVNQWSGGWLFAYSGVTMELNPYAEKGSRAANIQIDNKPLQEASDYRYASYWYSHEPDAVNLVPVKDVRVFKTDSGAPMDATEVVVRYLQSLPERTVDPVLNRITLTQPLPAPQFGNEEMQPLRGAVTQMEKKV